ncbi:MAG: nucleoside triphosphate pyrophosphohydrolase [Pseudomonadota bacterium]
MNKDQYSVSDLLDIMCALRDSESGCPWDIKQSFETIAPYTIEEAYEVSDAITRGNMDELCDELGDLLLQVVYHSQMAQEENHFSFDDVVNAICHKMIRRHPHVFGNDEDIKQGQPDWEQIKSVERLEKSEQDQSALSHVSPGLPSMLRARKLQKKAAKVKFDWPDYQGVLEKLNEEISELEEAVRSSQSDKVKEEIGDVLFTVVNLCRHLKMDADITLQQANSKFEARFRLMERLALDKGLELAKLEIDELEALWGQSKSLNRME